MKKILLIALIVFAIGTKVFADDNLIQNNPQEHPINFKQLLLLLKIIKKQITIGNKVAWAFSPTIPKMSE